jgi:hypothetical protein
MKTHLIIEIGLDPEQLAYAEKLVAQYNASLASDTGFRRTMLNLLVTNVELPDTLAIGEAPNAT